MEVTTLNDGSSIRSGRMARSWIGHYAAVRRRAIGPARRLVRVLVLLLACHLVSALRVAHAADRIALMIGNSVYEHVTPLPNPGNDAADLGAALRRLGFEVTTVPDAGLADLNYALRQFARRSSGVEVALVFYAGHGMEMDGVNYLVPVDARLERDTDVKFDTVPLDRVLEATRGAGLRVVILDACRNNPLAAAMQRSDATRSISRGDFAPLNEQQLGGEMLVAYAAAEGTVAADGKGRNSPYTAALLAHLEQPLEIGTMFRRVRAQVLTSTRQQQRPHEYQSLLREHYLAGEPAAVAESPPLPDTTEDRADTPTQSIQQREAWQEVVFWESVRESEFPEDFEEFLRLWPEGIYAPLATSRLRRLRAAEASTTAVTAETGGNRPSAVSSEVPAPVSDPQPGPGSSGVPAPVSGTLPSSVSTSLPAPVSGTLPSPASTSLPAPVSGAPPSSDSSGAAPAASDTRPTPISSHTATTASDARPSPVSPDAPSSSATPPGSASTANVPDLLDLIEPEGPAGMQFVWIAPGEFQMGSVGSEADEDEAPVTSVRIRRGFWLGKYEVTQSEWMAVMGSNPSGFSGCGRCPVERVSWEDVQEFLQRINANELGNPYRLPTEAEWEYAARAGTTEDRYMASLDASAWHRSNSGLRTRPVGQREPNAFGLYDVLGNVWEWVHDWKDRYSGGDVTDPRGPQSGSKRVYRGCSWISDAKGCRMSLRYADASGYRFNHLGFRLLRRLP